VLGAAECRQHALPMEIDAPAVPGQAVEVSTKFTVTSRANTNLNKLGSESATTTPSNANTNLHNRVLGSQPSPRLAHGRTDDSEIMSRSLSPPRLNHNAFARTPSPPPVESPRPRPWSRVVHGGTDDSRLSMMPTPPALNLNTLIRIPSPPLNESPRPKPWCRVARSPEPNLDLIEGKEQSVAPTNSLDARPLFHKPAPANNSDAPRPSPKPRSNAPLLALPPTSNVVDSSNWPSHMVDANRYFNEETVTVEGVSTTIVRDWGERWLAVVPVVLY